MKCLAFSLAVSPLAGCAGGLGYVFGSFLRATSYSPDMEDILFSHAMLGFALIESFMLITVMVLGLIYVY